MRIFNLQEHSFLRTKGNTTNKLIKGLILLFLIVMILYPKASYEGATTGLLLWFHNVLPNLLPFIIVSNLMIQLNITKQISKVFYPVLGKLFKVSPEACYPIVIGFLSGIPMGAKSTADLLSEDKIKRKEGQFLISMCNNASPMFIIGFISITQLKLPRIKYSLFVIIYGAAIISGLIYRYISQKREDKKITPRLKAASLNPLNQNQESSSHLELHNQKPDHELAISKQNKDMRKNISFEIVDNTIMNGFEVVTKIGGYIILFSIMAQIIKEALPGMVYTKAVLMGLLEITTGINQVCKMPLSDDVKIVLVSVLTSFGGLSGMAQTKSVIGDTRLSIVTYSIVKLMSAFLAFILSLIYVVLLYH